MPVVDLIGSSYLSKASFNSNRECINWYLEPDNNGKYNVILQPTPGLSAFTTTTGTNVRALLNYNETLYGVTSERFFSCNSSGTITYIGNLNTAVGRVSINAVKDQIALVDGYNGYTYTISTNTFAQITDVDFPNGSKTVTTSSGRFVFEQPSTEKFWWSNLRDGTTIDSLAFASAESQTDDLIAVFCTGKYIFMFGRFTTELWENIGGLEVITPITGTFIDYGCVAPYSITQSENSLFWLSRNKSGQGQVIQTMDFDTRVISDPAMTYQMSQYSDLTDAFGYCFQMLGHVFYVLTFPTANVTWLYDVNTDKWTKMLSYNGMTDGRHKSNCYAFCYGKHLVGDFQSGSIYELTSNSYTDAGSRIKRLLRFPFPTHENHRITVGNLEISAQKGAGLTTGQGSDPKIMFRFSKDGGHTWGNERQRPLNPLGEYRARAVFALVGQGYQPYGELSITDPIYCPILGASAFISPESKEG